MSFDPQSYYLRQSLSQHPGLQKEDRALRERGFQMVKLDATDVTVPAVTATLNFESPMKNQS